MLILPQDSFHQQKGAFVGEKNLDVIKMHGTTIKKIVDSACPLSSPINVVTDVFFTLSALIAFCFVCLGRRS